MATRDTLEKDINAQKLSITEFDGRLKSLEAQRTLAWTLFGAVVTGAIVWLGILTNKIEKILEKSAWTDGKQGNPFESTIQGLTKPTSNDALVANLRLLSAQIQVARIKGSPSRPKELAPLSSSLESVTRQHPDIPQAWQAAGQLVSFKLGKSTPSEPASCLGQKDSILESLLHGQLSYQQLLSHYQASGLGLHYADCTLVLDDVDGFTGSYNFKALSSVRADPPMFTLNLKNVKVVYRGGEVIPIRAIKCDSCYFVFDFPLVVPPARGKNLTEELLRASDGSPINLDLSAGM